MLKCCCLTGLGICVVAAFVARYIYRRRGLIDGSLFGVSVSGHASFRWEVLVKNQTSTNTEQQSHKYKIDQEGAEALVV
jgi:hypothetical protein